jgi:hypothetical protein
VRIEIADIRGRGAEPEFRLRRMGRQQGQPGGRQENGKRSRK